MFNFISQIYLFRSNDQFENSAVRHFTISLLAKSLDTIDAGSGE